MQDGAERSIPGFSEFLREIDAAAPEMNYVWSKEKEESCRWIMDRVPPSGRGIDIGGTEYLCEELAKRGCQTTFYDRVPPKNYPEFVQDDMINVLSHFKPRSMDFIATRHTLEHSLCPLFQLWAYNLLLKDNGRLLVVVPTHNSNWIWFNTHYNCLPYDNWIMLFYRSGFRIARADAGTWKPADPKFIEYRFDLRIESRQLRL